MAINKKLIHFKKFDDFIGSNGINGATQPTSDGYYGNIPRNAIVFIQDTQQIWTHGTLYDGSTFDPSNIEASIQNIIDSYATKAEIPTKVSQLENDTDYITKTEVADDYQVKGNYIEDDVFENGVYIVDLNGTLHDPNTFTGTADDATGIGLVTDKGAWIVALDEWYSRSASTAWNGNTRSAWGGYGKTVTGCWVGTSGYLNDFDGEANTDAIITQLKGTTDDYSQYYTGAPAAEYCRAYSKGYKDVGSWYLPAAGELNEIVLNKDAINAILTKLGKNNLSKNSYTWSSSQSNSTGAWAYYWSNSNWDDYNKASNRGVRPITKLTVSFIISRIESLENNKADKTKIPTKISQLENDANYIQDDVVSDGVYAVDANGKLIDYTIADSSCIGVALITDNQRILISKANVTDGTNTTLYWGKNLYGKDVASITNISSSNEAKQDFNGKANTAAIIAAYSQYSVDMDSRDMCKVLSTYAEGGFTDWYLPAEGQLYEMYTNKTDINVALVNIGGTAFESYGYWSSSEYDASHAWNVNFNDGHVDYNFEIDSRRVRFVRDISVPKSLKERVSELESSKQNTLISGTNIKTINGESILGSGNIVIEGGSSSGGSGAYAEVNHGTSDTTFTLTPNTFHVWDEVASLDLSFADEQAGVANEYLFQFTSGATATTLTLPDGLKWTNIPTISENMIYQVSILKGIASMLGVIYKIITKFYLNTGSDTIEYTIEEGMTWGQFVDSNYNNGDFAKLGDYYVRHTEGIVTDSGLNVEQSDIIVPVKNYIIID